MSAKGLWEQVKSELQGDLPRATFDTWIRDAEGLSLKDNVLTVGVANSYARDWLEERIGVMSARYVAALLETNDAEVHFVVSQDLGLADENEPVEVEDDEFLLQHRYLTLYDEIVRPERVVVIPRYYLRWVPWLGINLAWIPIGFRQVAYLRGSRFEAGDTFAAPVRELAAWSGTPVRTFNRRITDPRLRWFIEPDETTEVEFRWNSEKDHYERLPSMWRVVMSMPLTPADQASLKSWLTDKRQLGAAPVSIIQEAVETSIDELLPWPDHIPSDPEPGDPVTVQDLVMDILGREADPSTKTSLLQLADSLAGYITGNSRGHIIFTHYFIRKWLPLLKPGPAWLVAFLRSRCYYNRETNELRNQSTIAGGYDEIATRLGLSRSYTVGEWFRGRGKRRGKQQGAQYLQYFVEELERRKVRSTKSLITFKVRMTDEPMVPEDLERYNLTAIAASTNANGIMKIGSTNAIGTMERVSINADGIMEDRSTDANGTLDGTSTNADGTNLNDSLYSRLFKDSLKDYLTTTTTTAAELQSSSKTRQSGSVVVVWDLEKLLNHNRVESKAKKELIGASVEPELLVSWLLYAASQPGNSIDKPINHAVSRLRKEPRVGAGGKFEVLANLPPADLARLIISSQDPESIRWSANEDWSWAMKGASSLQMESLAEQLLSMKEKQEGV